MGTPPSVVSLCSALHQLSSAATVIFISQTRIPAAATNSARPLYQPPRFGAAQLPHVCLVLQKTVAKPHTPCRHTEKAFTRKDSICFRWAHSIAQCEVVQAACDLHGPAQSKHEWPRTDCPPTEASSMEAVSASGSRMPNETSSRSHGMQACAVTEG